MASYFWKLRVTRFPVSGSGPFPYDMLRYDLCYPDGSDDASQLAPHNVEQRQITLVRSAGTSLPAIDRWASFGWVVTNIEQLPSN